MRIVLQRVLKAQVKVDETIAGSIDRGIVALVGINTGDNKETFVKMFNKIINLRIFQDEQDKMNKSILDNDYSVLLIPNFTIYADARKGNRPSFANGAKPSEAKIIYDDFVKYAKANYLKVESGIFMADMKVELINDGPVTILLDSDRLF